MKAAAERGFAPPKIVYFIFRIKYGADEYKTLSILQKINNTKSSFTGALAPALYVAPP
jgi:hypothetical protein